MGDGEEDYMSMTFGEPCQPVKETSIQRTARQKRENEKRSRPKSKAELAEQERANREAGLYTSIDESNKGYQLMQKLGFKGGGLGKAGEDGEQGHGRTEPIQPALKESRGGVGLDSQKKRKIRETAENDVKRAKVDEGDYRERVRKEREEKRRESQFIGAMKVAERLSEDEENAARASDKEPSGNEAPSENTQKDRAGLWNPPGKPLKGVNLLWRNLVRHRVEKERERRMRYDLHQSLSRLPTYDDPDEDKDYKMASGREEEELEEEDAELDEFNALEPEVRLTKVIQHLRQKHHYCFWCKCSYPDAAMNDCPGEREEDHD